MPATLLRLVSLAGLLLSTALSASPVKNYPLVNQEGKPFQLHDLKGRYSMVTFIYSRCPLPRMCPLTMTLSNQLVRKWKADKSLSGKAPLRILAVTLDPAYDTPAVLKRFGKSHGVDFKHFTLATGDAQVLADLAGEFNVIGFPAQGTISHNMKNALVAPDMTVLKEYTDNEWKPDDVLRAIAAHIERERAPKAEPPSSRLSPRQASPSGEQPAPPGAGT